MKPADRIIPAATMNVSPAMFLIEGVMRVAGNAQSLRRRHASFVDDQTQMRPTKSKILSSLLRAAMETIIRSRATFEIPFH